MDVSVFDVAGRHLATRQLTAGTHHRSWDMRGVSNGLYFVRLQRGEVTETKSVLKIR